MFVKRSILLGFNLVSIKEFTRDVFEAYYATRYLLSMVILVVKFSSGGYKIRKVFA